MPNIGHPLATWSRLTTVKVHVGSSVPELSVPLNHGGQLLSRPASWVSPLGLPLPSFWEFHSSVLCCIPSFSSLSQPLILLEALSVAFWERLMGSKSWSTYVPQISHLSSSLEIIELSINSRLEIIFTVIVPLYCVWVSEKFSALVLKIPKSFFLFSKYFFF